MRKELGNVIVGTGIVIGAIALSNSAFSWGTKKQLLERDGGACVICGATDHLEAAHINHDKTKPYYDKPSNGRILCIEDHLKDHINRHGSNGLSKRANEWAIEAIKRRLP